MIFHQFFEKESSTYTYLIGSLKTAQAVLIDPVLEDVKQYIQHIKQYQLKLVATMETHTHADHITGSGALAKKTACKSMMGEQTHAEYIDLKFKDNEILDFDDFQLKALYTPGHTNDSYCFLWNKCIFTGDTLLIGATGRTDFQEGSAEKQYHSLFHKILKLPEETIVYPAHDYKGNTKSTIGQELRTNPRLQVSSMAEYVDRMNALALPRPKKIDIAVPANLKNGLIEGYEAFL